MPFTSNKTCTAQETSVEHSPVVEVPDEAELRGPKRSPVSAQVDRVREGMRSSRKRSGIVLRPGIVLLPFGHTPFSQQAALRSPLQALPGSVEHLMPKPGSAARNWLEPGQCLQKLLHFKPREAPQLRNPSKPLRPQDFSHSSLVPP